MASVAGVVGSVVKWALVSVGVVVLLLALGVYWLFSGGEKKQTPQPVAVSVPVQQMSHAEKSACECYTGAELCTGPQGGKYCVSDDGKKRYR